MSNIYVGGISFDSGFSTGFKTTPLEISLVHFETLSPTVLNTSNELIDVISSNVEINLNDPSVVVTSNTFINVNQNNIEINPLTPNVIAGVSQTVSESIIDITTNDISTNAGITFIVDESIIDITTNDISTNAGTTFIVDESVIDINSNDVTNVGITFTVDESVIDINSNDVTVNAGTTFIVDESVIDINSNDVTNVGITFIVPESNININNNDAALKFDSFISTNHNEIIINSNDVITSTSDGIFIDNVSVLSTVSNEVSYSIGSEINVSTRVINIHPVTIDGAGEKIPEWEDCLNIDNPYWDKDSECRDNESNMHDNILNDMFNNFGIPGIWYQVDYSTNNEKVFGEDNDRTIERNFNVQYYTEQLPQDDKLWSKWGIEGMDNFHIYVAKSHFYEASQLNLSGNIASRPTLPKQGDIIKSTHNNVYYEVVEVKDKVDMFLQRSHTWDITIAPNVDKKYNVNLNLINDDINNHINQEDILGQNNLIDQKKDDVLYDDPNGNDPYGLF